jgi:hypothetical protein
MTSRSCVHRNNNNNITSTTAGLTLCTLNV